MNHQEAKLILQAYHPDGREASDPVFGEALEQVRRDPELEKWFARENALETRVQGRLQTAIPLPPELKSSLLALRKIVRPVPWWRQPARLAAAAVVMLVVGLAMVLVRPRPPAQLVSFRDTMARYSMQEQGHISFHSHNLASVEQWMQSRNQGTNFDLPAGLRGGAVHGCRVVDWNGRKATMICFVLDGGEHMDLFVMDRAGMPGVSDDGAPQFAAAGRLMTAVWARGDKVYLLASSDGNFLQKFLHPI